MTQRPRKTDKAAPFTSDAQYLDAEFLWLKARCRRLAAQGDLRRQVEQMGRAALDSQEAAELRRLSALEGRLRRELDQRLEATRTLTDGHRLGLDRLFGEAALRACPLDDDDRTVLLALTLLGLSQDLAEQVLAPIHISAFGLVTVSDALRLLDPQDAARALALRRHFRRTGPLLRLGLVTLRTSNRTQGPDCLLEADLTLTLEAFANITGDPEVLDEINPNDANA